MKKRDLLFAGLLFAVPAFAQDAPTFTPQDAKVIFTQNFEDDWDNWQSTPVDTIYQLEYYKGVTGGNQQFSNAWTDARFKADNLLVRTDSVSEGKEGGIIIYNGVMLTDDKDDIANDKYRNDSYTIAEDNSVERKDAFAQWGEDGGQKIFRFTSASRYGADGESIVGADDNKYTDNYRRNLFVRLKDVIEPETSYRLTFYVKAKSTTKSSAYSPRLHTALFRGYFHSEKEFTMGLQNDNDNYKYDTSISYTKEDFTGDWEKVVYMDYYLNDSIADYYMLSSGYWWSDNWVWKAADNGTEDDLKFIKQPDKFFFRMSFQSDSTDFMVDNISLTKSWIGGCEYDKDKMRVDFGYKTNLSEIVAANKKLTNMPAVDVQCEVPDSLKEELGYDWRIQVWGLKANDEWEEVYMRSAEYHDDGYMYLFTEFYNDDQAYQFDEYKKVLVTFHNPTDIPEMTLKYTGTGKDVANLFPKALDTTWIKNGKIVPDFFNEIATPNPNVFAGVHSLADLPPVLQSTEIPDGSFFLTPRSSFSFSFSREIVIDNEGAASTKAIGTVNGVVWTPSFDKETNTLTITCPDDSWKNLNGDVEVKLIQLYGKGTDKGENVVMNYNFGAPSREVSLEKIDLSFALNGEHGSIAPGVITYSASNYTVGDGKTISGANNQNRLFLHNVAGSGITAGYEVRPHGANNGGHVYIGTDEDHKITIKPGDYMFKFKGTGWSWNNGDIKPATVYLFPYTEDDLRNVDASTKIELGVYNASAKTGDGDLQNADYAIPAANVDEVVYKFSIAEEGDYIIEFNNKAGAWSQGVFVGDFELTEASSTAIYVDGLNNALALAKDCAELAKVDLDIYGGESYNTLLAKIDYYEIGGEFDKSLATEIEAWTDAKKDLVDVTSAQSDRMSKVDLMQTGLEELNGAADEASADEQNLDEYKAIAAAAELYAGVDYTVMTVDSIVKATDDFKALVKALTDHRTKIDDFVNLLANVDEQLGNTAYAAFAEFQAMDSVYKVYENFDLYNNTLTDLTAAYNALQASLDAWNGKYNAKGIYDMQIEAIAKLVDELQGSIPEGVRNLDVLLDDKLGFYMLYAKKALYEAILDDPAIDSIDVSAAFITNGELYTTTKASQLGNNCNMAGKEGDFFPGWTYTFKKGNPYMGGTSWSGGKASSDGKPYNTFINLDWNTGFTMEQTIEYLPAGKYTLGVGYGIAPDANDGSFKVYELGDEDVLIADTAFYTNAGAGGTGSGTKANNFLSFENKNGVRLFINPSCGNNGWNSFDNVTLLFINAAEEFDYDGALDEVEAAITEKLKATAVIPAKAVKGVKYYDVNGVELKAPKAGLNIIVVDGVATKVLVK